MGTPESDMILVSKEWLLRLHQAIYKAIDSNRGNLDGFSDWYKTEGGDYSFENGNTTVARALYFITRPFRLMREMRVNWKDRSGGARKFSPQTWKVRYTGGSGSTGNLTISIYQHPCDGVARNSVSWLERLNSEHATLAEALLAAGHHIETYELWPSYFRVIPDIGQWGKQKAA